MCLLGFRIVHPRGLAHRSMTAKAFLRPEICLLLILQGFRRPPVSPRPLPPRHLRVLGSHFLRHPRNSTRHDNESRLGEQMLHDQQRLDYPLLKTTQHFLDRSPRPSPLFRQRLNSTTRVMSPKP